MQPLLHRCAASARYTPIAAKIVKHAIGRDVDTMANADNSIYILKKYRKPKAKEIRERLTRGDDSRETSALQKLRKKFGLT